MKQLYTVPIQWIAKSTIDIEAESMEEAVNFIRNYPEDIPCSEMEINKDTCTIPIDSGKQLSSKEIADILIERYGETGDELGSNAVTLFEDDCERIYKAHRKEIVF